MIEDQDFELVAIRRRPVGRVHLERRRPGLADLAVPAE